jgi:hypothetical protein
MDEERDSVEIERRTSGPGRCRLTAEDAGVERDGGIGVRREQGDFGKHGGQQRSG